MSEESPNIIAVARGSMQEMKELAEQCEREGIIVSLDRCRGTS